mgnify:CR=1 FL=1
MIEFKITRLKPLTSELYDEYDAFADEEAANNWAQEVNEGGAGTHMVAYMEVMADYNHGEEKYEY